MAERWIAVSTNIFEHPIVGAGKREPWPPMAVWLWMVAQAAHKPHSLRVHGFGLNATIKVRRGQLVLAQRRLAEVANWTRKQVRAFYLRLEQAGMITIDTGEARCDENGQLSLAVESADRGPREGPNKVTVLTICNYDKYQSTPEPKGPKAESARGPRRGPESTMDTESTKKKKERERPAASPAPSAFWLPADWVLPDAWAVWATKEGPNHLHLIDTEGKKFKAHWRGKQRAETEVGWESEWQKWWLRTIERPAEAGRPAQRARGTYEAGPTVRDTSESWKDYQARMIREGHYKPPA